MSCFEITKRLVNTGNGLIMNCYTCGNEKGPLFLMLHGFPEIGWSYRHQLRYFGNKGFYAVAPDQRGYGQTKGWEQKKDKDQDQDKDENSYIQSFDLFNLVKDIIGLTYGLKYEKAIIMGHDWGAPIAFWCSMIRPDIFQKLILLSNPCSSPNEITIEDTYTNAMKELTSKGMIHYHQWLCSPKTIDEINQNIGNFLKSCLFSCSSSSQMSKSFSSEKNQLAPIMWPISQSWFEISELPKENEMNWFSENDLKIYIENWKETNFYGSINWFKNINRERNLTQLYTKKNFKFPCYLLQESMISCIKCPKKNLIL